MIERKANHRTQPKIAVAPKSSPAKVAMMTDTAPSQDRIRERAYELYEARGCEPGRAEPDWLRAEQEILKQRR
ncbi:MAG: DUF2934 domain-containing protein [Terriglobales bacterium]